MSALLHIAVVANPHFARLGGESAVVRLVDAFYAAMDRRADAPLRDELFTAFTKIARHLAGPSPHSHATPTRSPP